MAGWNARANDLFLRAIELTETSACEQFLDRECGADASLRDAVAALLRAHERAGDFLKAPEPAAAGTATFSIPGGDPEPTASLPPAAEQPGTVVAGRYKLLEQIGEGGMGAVWMAQQTEPVKRRVAVKLIRADRGASRTILTRFEAERQAIALMNHPNIAKLLDAGTTDDGQPFFVMELVKGVPLTEYCDAHRLSLAVRQKLAADFPDDPARQTELGWAFVRSGERARADKMPTVALDGYAKAIAAAGPVFQKNPSFDSARLCLRQAHWARGHTRADARKHAEAVQEFSRALELSTGPDRIDPLSLLAVNRFHAGQVVEALRAADELAKEDGPAAAYNAACVYSLASGKLADKKAEYGKRAMELLRRAVAAGFQDITLMKTDTDLDPLRARTDFKVFLADLEREFPPPPEVAPPPREKK